MARASLTWDRLLPADHPSAAGHFPGNPLVPGVLLLDEVLAAAREWLHQSGGRWCIERAKFVTPVAFGTPFRITLTSLSIPSFNYQMTPKISLNTRCSISISENLSINGQTRSSDQLGIWSYNINP